MDHASSSDKSQERNGHLTNTDPIRFAGSFLGEKRHICGFFNSADEEYKVLLPFIKEGFDRGEKAFHVVDPKLRDDHVQRLESIGINVTQAKDSGQFELCDWEGAYFREGHFDQNRMLGMWKEVFATSTEEGFPLTRLVAHMEWALEDREGKVGDRDYLTQSIHRLRRQGLWTSVLGKSLTLVIRGFKLEVQRNVI